ncbi:hypothetical protein ACFQ88_33915 [Paenibacillus sp. NPDC056579]|uniref:hypothetical protein n=1 Tax=Paenibacillus sp. NPDC056579 TaxID=3345871 RepID=UPI0036BCE7A3
MSIEHQLKNELQQYAKQMRYPRELDERINRLSVRVRKAAKPGKTARIALIAACIFLFSGIAYASSLLYTMHSGKVSVEVSKDEQVQLPDKVNAEIRASFQDIRNRLKPGESAIVYISELEKRNLPALTRVNRPIEYTELNPWAELIKASEGVPLKMPTMMPQGFTFSYGELEAPVGLVDATSYSLYSKLLKDKASKSKQSIVWERDTRPQAASAGLKSPGLVYMNPKGDPIEIRYQVLESADGKIDMSLRTGSATTGEKVTVNGKDGYFTVNNSSFLSDTGTQSTVSWLEESSNGRTIIYQISAFSPNIGKEELLLAANGLK